MEEILTATHKIFVTDYIAEIPNPAMVFIRILGSSIAEIAEVFGNPEETRELVAGERILKNYRFLALTAEGEACKVSLVRA